MKPKPALAHVPSYYDQTHCTGMGGPFFVFHEEHLILAVLFLFDRCTGPKSRLRIAPRD